jgi:tetratricopeptide (TPR) repeat protein
MKLTDIKKFAGIVAVFAGISSGLIAQVKNDAINVFNQGVELMKVNDPKAIETFEKCIIVCDQIGDSAADIKAKAASVLPDLYYKKAYNLLTVDKKINESLAASKVTVKVAEKYGDTEAKASAEKLMVQAYSNMAAGYVAAKENEKAIQAYDSVLMINPDHTSSIYNKALLYKGLDNAPKFTESIDLFISKMSASGDSAKVAQASKVARDYFRLAASKANKANKLPDAISLLNTASKYGFDNSVYYQYASVYNKQKKFSLAVENAQKGLDLETGTTPEDKAKYYYELGTAQAGLGKTGEACTSLGNAMYGPFLEAAKAQRTNMKCK